MTWQIAFEELEAASLKTQHRRRHRHECRSSMTNKMSFAVVPSTKLPGQASNWLEPPFHLGTEKDRCETKFCLILDFQRAVEQSLKGRVLYRVFKQNRKFVLSVNHIREVVAIEKQYLQLLAF